MKKIIMAEFLEYESDFRVGNHHYAKLFSENGFEVLWLSPVYNHLYYLKDKKLYEQRKTLHNSSLVKLDDNIFGYAPYSPILYGNLPILDSKVANKLSVRCTSPNLYSVLKKIGYGNADILWLSNPKYYPLMNNIKYKKLFYRCADDISAFRGTCRTMKFFEEEIIKKADKVFVTSHNLIEKKKYLRSDLTYLPNGVEITNFIRDRYILPLEYKNNKRKKCVYIGAIANWFDLKLVRYCAEELKDLDFYLIGPVRIDLSILERYKNVYILGEKNYKDLPNYLYYSDVAIIPFEVNTLTDSITPIKLYEYMSLGINVVSTRFKEMEYLDSPAYVAKDYNEFCRYIRDAIINKENNRERNIQYATRNTWLKRFEKIKQYLD